MEPVRAVLFDFGHTLVDFRRTEEALHEAYEQIRARIEQVRRSKQMRVPIAINGWTLALALGCLGGEWLLRKRWGLT